MREVVVFDKMQQGYRYVLTKPVGQDFDVGFEPELTPPQMLAMGVFEGKYLNDCQNEFPKSWWQNARLSQSGKAEVWQNCFGVKSRMSLGEWQQKGWIIGRMCAVGFSGIAAIIWDGGCRRLMPCK